MEERDPKSLLSHLTLVKEGERRFENAFQSVTRMFQSFGVEEANFCGRTINEFLFFRQGKKHLIGLYDEINQVVGYTKDASEGGSSNEMAIVLVGEPGNGKTFFVEFICKGYRKFLSQKGNEKYTFRFVGMNDLKTYGNIELIESQTYEDPMILAMNLFEDEEKNKEFLSEKGFSSDEIDTFYRNYRPLGACSAYILNDIREHCDGNIDDMLSRIKIARVPLTESLGTVTGKYPAKDKITSSSVDLLGEESIQRLMHLKDLSNPFKFDLRRGALARVAGGGIHFADEIFKNKTDLVQVYLGVIQNRAIEMDGYRWPMDTLIIATSNNSEFNRFKAEKEQAPIVDRCRICYVSHNTNYKLQKELTRYAIGSEEKTVVGGEEKLHEDPNLNHAASVAVVLTRLLTSKKLSRIETLKLAAGEIAGEKSIKMLAEVIDEANKNPDLMKRWGQKGMSQRNLGRALQLLLESSETTKGKCMTAHDVFEAFERIVLDYVEDTNDKEKYMADIKEAKKLYREHIQTELFNAYMDEPKAIQKDVLNYVNMIIGIDAENLGPDKTWRYRDPQTDEMKAIKIDERWVKSVEERLELKSEEKRQSFRTTIRKIYGQKISIDQNYDFMDNVELVKAVTETRLKSDVAGAGSLVGALANLTNEENIKLRDKIMKSMIDQLGYCKTCALKTIEYFCTTEDQ